MLETIGRDLDEARAKIVATLESLRSALDRQDGDVPELTQAIAGLQRLEAELDRIEAGIAVREGLA